MDLFCMSYLFRSAWYLKVSLLQYCARSLLLLPLTVSLGCTQLPQHLPMTCPGSFQLFSATKDAVTDILLHVSLRTDVSSP